MKALYFIVGGIVIAILVWLIRNSRLAVETAPYTLVRTDGVVELRDYPVLILVTTPMNDGESNGSFGRLFGFITGKNAKAEKIPMTTPVLIDPATGKQTMSFVLPESLVPKGAPEPGDHEVRLNKLEPGRYAVLRFRSGSSNEARQAAVDQLQTWLRNHGIAAEGEPVFAYYDPPWTPLFLRRNEVLIRVGEDTK